MFYRPRFIARVVGDFVYQAVRHTHGVKIKMICVMSQVWLCSVDILAAIESEAAVSAYIEEPLLLAHLVTQLVRRGDKDKPTNQNLEIEDLCFKSVMCVCIILIGMAVILTCFRRKEVSYKPNF